MHDVVAAHGLADVLHDGAAQGEVRLRGLGGLAVNDRPDIDLLLPVRAADEPVEALLFVGERNFLRRGAPAGGAASGPRGACPVAPGASRCRGCRTPSRRSRRPAPSTSREKNSVSEQAVQTRGLKIVVAVDAGLQQGAARQVPQVRERAGPGRVGVRECPAARPDARPDQGLRSCPGPRRSVARAFHRLAERLGRGLARAMLTSPMPYQSGSKSSTTTLSL